MSGDRRRHRVRGHLGASGSGKSSLARAGVAPALRRDGRDVAVVNPGATPDRLLAGIDKGSVLVVDQLEELFVLCHDPAARARFAAGVCRWAATAPVVATLRADHLGEVTELPELAARVQSGIYLLGAMGEPQLRAAIDGPAAKAGLRLEPGLVDLLVRDVAGEPGALPLLSHALAETYERREGRCSLPLRELEIGQLHDIEHFVEVFRIVHDQRCVPVDDDQVVLVVAEVFAG